MSKRASSICRSESIKSVLFNVLLDSRVHETIDPFASSE